MIHSTLPIWPLATMETAIFSNEKQIWLSVRERKIAEIQTVGIGQVFFISPNGLMKPPVKRKWDIANAEAIVNLAIGPAETRCLNNEAQMGLRFTKYEILGLQNSKEFLAGPSLLNERAAAIERKISFSAWRRSLDVFL